MIVPTSEDIGREVRLHPFGCDPITGRLVEIEPEVRCEWPGFRFPITTDPAKLEWVEG
jgi:hypothetical protein